MKGRLGSLQGLFVVLLWLLCCLPSKAQLPEESFPGGQPTQTQPPETVQVPATDQPPVALTAQQRRDSIRRAKLAGLARNKGENEFYYDLYMQSGLPRFDTMRFPLDGFQKFDPAYQHNDFRNNRGSLGMPDQPIEYNPRRTAGFSLRTNPFSSWFYTQENTPFMQSKTPYTYLYFVNNFGQDLNFFRAIHNQNVARGLNLGVDFRVYDVYGAYTNSRSNQYNVRVTGNYITRDAKYRILFGYIHNVAAVGENGGIRTDSLFTKNMETNRLRIPVSLSDARTRWRENKYFFKQSYHFYDNQKDSIAENNKSYGYLTHSFEIQDLLMTYRDQTTAADGFYENFFMNPAESREQNVLMKMTNRVFYSSADMETLPFGYAFKFAAGFKNEYIRWHDKMVFHDWVQWFPFARVQIDFADRFVFDAYLDFGFGGYNQFDFSGWAMFKYLFKDDAQRSLPKRDGIEVRLGVNRFEPDWIYTYHASNHFYWENDWRKNMEAYLQLEVGLKGWWLRAKAGLLQDYSFLKADGPAQAEREFLVVNVVAGKNLRIGKYVGLDNLLMFAYSSAPEYLHVPLFSLQENVYGIIPIKGLAEIQVGLEFLYNTSYYADAYSPVTASYYWQDEVRTGNFVMMNVFLNFQVKRANLFVKGLNIAQGLFGHNYIQTPHYPLVDRCVRFGVSWRFFD